MCSSPISPSSSSSSSPSSSPIDEETVPPVTLIPGLPNDLSALILAFLPYSHYSRLKPTCKSWNIFLSSKTLISLRRIHLPISHLSHLLCIFPEDPSISTPFLFDPQTLAWRPLPLMPCNPHAYGLCNFASVSVNSHLYVLGGSSFDTRSFPIDRPTPSRSVFRYDVSGGASSWDVLSPMLSPRGSFACAAIPDSGRILVAGGGSRHTFFGAAGSVMSSVEMYDIGKDEWIALDHLPRFRAGCMGFLVGNGDDEEFWVMGGYGESRTVSEMFPVDEYCRDAVKLKNGGKWKEVGDMWEEGERTRLGKIVVVHDQDNGFPGIFMLDGSNILRYDMAFNRWRKESSVPRRVPKDSPFGFVVLHGELHVMTLLKRVDQTEIWRPRQHKKAATLFIQIYHPANKTWRSLVTKPPCHDPLNFKTAVMCTIRL